MPDAAIWVWICDDCQAGQCGLCIEANEIQTPGPGCDCEHEDWDEEAHIVTPQPRRRRLWAVQCPDCGRVLLGSTRRSGRGWRRYARHWQDAHGGGR